MELARKMKASQKDTASLLPESKPLKILAVDDDPLIREVLQEALIDFGYEVTTAENGEKALQSLKTERFKLVMSDVAMPGINGVELAERISAIHPDMPIILITGYGNVDMAKNALQRGASDFLIKPFNVQELPIIITRNLERRRLETIRLNRNGKETLLKAIRALARAIDAKDPYTAGHSDRVARIAVAIAKKMKFPEAELYQLRLAAEMHDVGKIGVPDDILKKAGSLTNEEWELMRKHCEIGSRIIGEIEELARTASIIRHHHERYDGKGYPDGLQEDAIPLHARIIAVADTYEAMTSNRSYRERFSKEKAKSILHEVSGTQLDAKIVGLFLELLDNGAEL